MSSKLKNILSKLILGLAPLVTVWALDWYTKNWAIDLSGSRHFGFLHFELVYNHGVMLGFSSKLPLMVKIVTLTTLGAMIFCSYAMLFIIVPIRSLLLRLGLPILVGGIIGNVTDRFIHSAVIDFIAFRFNHHSTPVMNVADICQWIGYACIVFGLFQDSRYYWPTLDLRNKFFINPSFQIRTGLIMGLFSFVAGFVMLVFGISFFQDNLAQYNVRFYLIYGLALTSFLSIATFGLGVFLSHRVAGPVFALRRYLNDSCQGKKLTFKLRENDEFKELENQLTMLNAEMQRLYEIEKNDKDENIPSLLPEDTIPETGTIKKIA